MNAKLSTNHKAYLFNHYSDEPVPCKRSEHNIYSNNKEEVTAFYTGRLVLTIRITGNTFYKT